MKVLKLFWVMLPAMLSPVALVAQNDSTMKFSLKEAQDYAIRNFYVSKNAKLDIEKAKKVVLETTAMGLPQVKASASWAYIPGTIPTIDFGSSIAEGLGSVFGDLIANGYLNRDSLPQAGAPTPIAEKSTITYGFTVSQLILNGEYIVGLRASKVYKSLYERINDKTEIGLKESVAEGYFSILILERNRKLLSEMLENLKSIKDQSEAYYKAGFMESTDVDQINLMVLSTETSLKTVERQIELLNKLFAYQLGMTDPVKIELTDSLDDLIASNIVDDTSYSFSLEDNVDYQMLDTQEKLMKLNLNRERAKYMPTVAGFYQYQDKNNKPVFDFTMKHLIGVSIEVPIIGSGSRIATTSQARIEYEKAQNTKDQEISRITMEAEQAVFNYRSALEKYQNEKLASDLAKKIYEKTNEKYKQGVTSSLDLTTVNNQYLQAQMTYAAAIQELLDAKVKLDKAYNKL